MAKRPTKPEAKPANAASPDDVSAPSAGLECSLGDGADDALVRVLVMQGGGALGAYQAGVYQAMHEAGCEPQWVIGTSIGAINAGIIAGNPPERRLPALQEFWRRMSVDNKLLFAPFNPFPAATTAVFGLPGFFSPHPLNVLGITGERGPEAASLYSTSPLEETLKELIDVDLLNAKSPRLTVGAVNIAHSDMRYFDSRDQPLTLHHLMASGALPPAFPAVRLSDGYYWDGGILSNTPLEAVFDDLQRQSSLIFSVEVWHRDGPVPASLNETFSRQKDIQYASRDRDQIRRQRQLHRLRHIITELSRLLPDDVAQKPEVMDLASYGCTTRMHVVRLRAPRLRGEDYLKDIDFSPHGVETRWKTGYDDAQRMLAEKPWSKGPFSPLDAVVVHKGPGHGEKNE